MSWLTEPFELAFMRDALLAGVLAAVTCSLVGTWVVVRGLSFLGDALAHGVLPGIALAAVLGFDVVLGAALSAVLMVAGIAVAGRRPRVGDDAAIGLLFVGMLALGVIVLSRAEVREGSLTGFLFGSLLTADRGAIAVQVAALAVVVVAVVVGYRPMVVLAFHRDKAEVLGLRPGPTHVALLGLVTVAVVSSFQAVGTLLVVALLVGPPATAALMVRRLPTQMAVAALLGALAVVTGLLVTYHADTAGGATVAATTVVQFFVVLGIRGLVEAVDRRRRPVPA